MCLAIPGILVERREREGLLLGTLDFGGVRKEVCLEFLPDLAPGEYAVVHAGYAISRLDPDSARQMIEEFTKLGFYEEEDSSPTNQTTPESKPGHG